MRKLFWFLYARIRLLYLYCGKGIPYYDRPDIDTKCPNCYKSVENYDFYDKEYLGSSDYYTGYEDAEYWTEHWKCKRCGCKFHIDSGN